MNTPAVVTSPKSALYPVQLTVRLRVAAPFNTAAAEPDLLGVDTPLLRDHRGRPVLPGSLLQGRLMEEISNWDAVNFPKLVQRQGRAASRDSNNQPLRKSLVLGDLVLQSEGGSKEPNHLITRVSLSAETRSAELGALQILESPAASGENLVFEGKAHAFVSGQEDAENLRQQLQTALRLVPNVGAERSVGFGQVLAVDVSLDKTPDAHAELKWPGEASAIDIALQFDRPLVVTDAPLSDNGFDAAEVIAGNVLKGVFADTCAALGLTPPPQLDAIVFRHAFCASGEERPRVNPASLVEADLGDDKPLIDLAHCKGPVLLSKGEGENTITSAPRFALDWKDNDPHYQGLTKQLADHFGRARPARQLRVRTAIDPQTRAAEDSKLFAYEALLHEQARSETASDPAANPTPDWRPHTWRSRIDLSALKSKEQATTARAIILETLRHGLYFLGKTKAIARLVEVNAASVDTRETTSNPQPGQTIILTLQTPALLTAAGAVQPGASAKDLHDAYSDYFKNASGGSLGLSHFYARQKLRGGGYQHHRFQKGGTYQPWLLTDAGAVFVLTVKDAAKAKTQLIEWLAQGLPPADGWSPDWRENPYQSANGFGEIALDQSCHRDWAPEKQGLSCRVVINLAATQPTAATA